MNRKGVMFLLAGLTVGATMLAPHAAGAAEATPRAVDGQRTQVLASPSHGSGGAGRIPSQVVAPIGRHFPPAGGPTGLADCPAGHHLSPFDMPIYDADGLFVIGHETVWFCIPDDLEPAG